MALTKPILQVYETKRSLFIASPFSIILFFKTNVTQSVTEFILYSQKTRNYGEIRCKNINNISIIKREFA